MTSSGVGDWSDEAGATVGFTDFMAAVKDADRYLVDRQERTNSAGAYIDLNIAFVVDAASQRTSSTKTYAVSDEALWAELTPEGQTVEETKSHTMRTVTDLSVDPPVTYLTYLGNYGWDGRWLVMDPADLSPDDIEPQPGDPDVDPDEMLDALAKVAIRDYTKAVRDVATLDPQSFESNSNTLSYAVPAELSAAWWPTELVLALQGEGVDPADLSATARAEITPIPGGIQAELDLTPWLREAAESVEDENAAQYLNSVSIPITFRIYDLATGARVELPAPDTLVTEPPTD